MKRILIMVGIFLATSAFGEGLTLVCSGEALVTEKTTVKSNEIPLNPGDTLTDGVTFTGKRNMNAVLTFYINEEETEGWVKVPRSMRPAFSRKDKFSLTKLSVGESEINAKFKINFMNQPKIVINRNTGFIEYNGMGASFSGACEKIDVAKKKF
jgi:hypothetical protein